MADTLDEVLRLVRDGWLTAEEAAPVIDALQGFGDQSEDETPEPTGPTPSRGRALRVEVSEDGRRVVNLRVPLSIGRMAIDHIPGLSSDNVVRIREALEQGLTGPILVVDDDADGSGVRIVIE